MIYLDWAGTSPPDPALLAEGLRMAEEYYGNPSSPHALGKAARTRLEEARSGLLGILGPGAAKGRLVFTGSGSEADALPLLALLRKASKDGTRPHIVASGIEHAAIHEELPVLTRFGLGATLVDPRPDGLLDPEAVAAALRPETEAVFVMAVNNETGAIQPLAEIAKAVASRAASLGKRRPRLHADAVQALGKLVFEPAALGIDSAAFSAHKLRGPRGVGALWAARDFEPLLLGGGQEGGLRPGTENLQGAWAFMRAATVAFRDLEARRRRALELERLLIEGLEGIGALPLPLGRRPGDPRYSPFILSAAFPGLSGEVMVRALANGIGAASSAGEGGAEPEQQGIAVSTGSACSTNLHRKGRRVLEAMGLDPALALGSIRVSTGELTAKEEIAAFLERAGLLRSRLGTWR